MKLEKIEIRRTDRHFYSSGEKGAKQIEIIFVDGIFSDCTFDFRGKYARYQWRILAAINEEIADLEVLYVANGV